MKVQCRVMIGGSIALMLIGSITDYVWMRGWGALVGIFAVGLCIHAAIRRWAYLPFEEGFKAGREVGIAEGFALAAGEPTKDRG